MNVVTLDVETHYDTKNGYSLARMPTEDYVADQRFEFIGIAAKVNDGPTSHLASNNTAELRDWLKQFDLPNSALAGHHLMFDGLCLAVHCDLYPAYYCCTESMSRPFLKPILRSLSLASVARHLGFGEKGDEVIRADGKRFVDFSPYELTEYMRYCENDVNLTRHIFNWARPQLNADEMLLIDSTMRMFTCPMFSLDAPLYEASLRDVRERKAQRRSEMDLQGVTADLLRSKNKFAELLREHGIEPPMKVSPAWLKAPPELRDPSKKMTYAFSKADPEYIALREAYAEDVDISLILDARIHEMSSIEETRNEALLELATRYPKFRVDISYYNAHTGRYSAGRDDKVQA